MQWPHVLNEWKSLYHSILEVEGFYIFESHEYPIHKRTQENATGSRWFFFFKKQLHKQTNKQKSMETKENKIYFQLKPSQEIYQETNQFQNLYYRESYYFYLNSAQFTQSLSRPAFMTPWIAAR